MRLLFSTFHEYSIYAPELFAVLQTIHSWDQKFHWQSPWNELQDWRNILLGHTTPRSNFSCSPFVPLHSSQFSLHFLHTTYVCVNPRSIPLQKWKPKQAATHSAILNSLPVNFSLKKICAVSRWGFPCTGSLIFVGSTVSAEYRHMNDEWLHNTTLPSTSRTCAAFPIWMAGYYWSS